MTTESDKWSPAAMDWKANNYEAFQSMRALQDYCVEFMEEMVYTNKANKDQMNAFVGLLTMGKTRAGKHFFDGMTTLIPELRLSRDTKENPANNNQCVEHLLSEIGDFRENMDNKATYLGQPFIAETFRTLAQQDTAQGEAVHHSDGPLRSSDIGTHLKHPRSQTSNISRSEAGGRGGNLETQPRSLMRSHANFSGSGRHPHHSAPHPVFEFDAGRSNRPGRQITTDAAVLTGPRHYPQLPRRNRRLSGSAFEFVPNRQSHMIRAQVQPENVETVVSQLGALHISNPHEPLDLRQDIIGSSFGVAMGQMPGHFMTGVRSPVFAPPRPAYHPSHFQFQGGYPHPEQIGRPGYVPFQLARVPSSIMRAIPLTYQYPSSSTAQSYLQPPMSGATGPYWQQQFTTPAPSNGLQAANTAKQLPASRNTHRASRGYRGQTSKGRRLR